MNKFNLKNYPPNVLIILICLITALSFGLQLLWKKFNNIETSLLTQTVTVLMSYSVVIGVMTFINKHMWLWWLKIIGLHDFNGEYTGKLVSSYLSDEKISTSNIQLSCKFTIVQNINGIHLEGSFFSEDNFSQKSSSFKSIEEEIQKLENGDFVIRYFFSNKGNQLHPDNEKYALTNHDGIAILTYSVKERKISGVYFNHERRSFGELFLNSIV